ncbi:MAG: sensor domain-containing diguanylate cyclase [Halofilum sp. (in: g-proteobacteria)]
MNPDASRLYQRIFEHHPTSQMLVDAHSGEILHANEAAVDLFGGSTARLVETRLPQLIEDLSDPGGAPIQCRLAATPLPLQVCLHIAGRGWCHIEIEGTRIEADSEQPLLHVTVRDITERIRTERALRDFEEIFEDVPVPFYRAAAGASGRFLRVNPALVRLFEADSAEQLLKLEIASLYVDPDERVRFSNTLIRDGEVMSYELRMRTVKGREIRTADTAFHHLDESGNPVFDGALEDITRRRELEEELSYQARYDKLTDLANRRHCEATLQTETERSDRYGQPLSALLIDIDHFKRINDERGHAEGDRVLEWIAKVLRNRVRETDLAGRWGGEEFVVLLPSTPATKAHRLAEELRRAVTEAPDSGLTPVTISVGYAGYARGEGNARFMQRLDRALYAAKGEGRNRVIAAEWPERGE